MIKIYNFINNKNLIKKNRYGKKNKNKYFTTIKNKGIKYIAKYI